MQAFKESGRVYQPQLIGIGSGPVMIHCIRTTVYQPQLIGIGSGINLLLPDGAEVYQPQLIGIGSRSTSWFQLQDSYTSLIEVGSSQRLPFHLEID